jgi:hypothetical protein
MSGRLSEPLLDTGWLGLVSPELDEPEPQVGNFSNFLKLLDLFKLPDLDV